MAEIESNDATVAHTGDTSLETEDDSEHVVQTPFSTKTWREDLTLIVQDKPLYVNKYVLAYASPVFDAMFTGEFKEKYQEEIPLPGKTYDDVVHFLQRIYPGPVPPVTIESVFSLLPLAHEYQVQYLEAACETYLIQYLTETHEHLNKVYEVLETASAYSLDKVIDKCVEMIAERLDDDTYERKDTLPDGIINAIKVKRLHVLKTKYKNVFGHVKTSRALYQFLGAKAKQNDLVERYTNGDLFGETVNLKVNCATFEASTEINIGGIIFSITVDNGMSCSRGSFNLTLSLRSRSLANYIHCLCEFHVLNWMDGKEDIRSELSKFELSNGKGHRIVSGSNHNIGTLKDQAAGFNYKGNIELRIFLFWMK